MRLTLSDIQFPKMLLVTEQGIDISRLTHAQQQAYLDLFEHIITVYESKKRPRVIVGLAGPTGAGKSVIAALFKEMAAQLALPFRLETVGIDAFHYPNEYLLTHTSDDQTLKDHKGRFDTYDISKLLRTLEDFKNGEHTTLPAYSRVTHESIDAATTVSNTNALLLLEGLWLLYDKNGWEHVAQYLDFSFFVKTDKNTVREAVIRRHMEGGRSLENASLYYDTVDAKNFDLVLATKDKADEIIPAFFYL